MFRYQIPTGDIPEEPQELPSSESPHNTTPNPTPIPADFKPPDGSQQDNSSYKPVDSKRRNKAARRNKNKYKDHRVLSHTRRKQSKIAASPKNLVSLDTLDSKNTSEVDTEKNQDVVDLVPDGQR